MEMIVTEIRKIIKESATPIQQEKAMYHFFVRFFCECLRLAFEQLDEEVATTYKQKLFRIERRNERTIHFLFGSVTYKKGGCHNRDKQTFTQEKRLFSATVTVVQAMSGTCLRS